MSDTVFSQAHIEDLRARYLEAQRRDRDFKLNSPEHKEHRQLMGRLGRELDAATKPATVPEFTAANYAEWPDSFHQIRANRKLASRNNISGNKRRKATA